MAAEAATISLQPLPYQQALVEYLRQEDDEVWRWYASDKLRQADAEAARLDLLKSTYYIEPETQPGLYELGRRAAAALGLDVPLHFYHAQRSQGQNAALVYIPHEAHIVLEGPVQSLLAENELRALIAHELAHYYLFAGWQGAYLTCRSVLGALTRDMESQNVHLTTARLFALYTELFADRGSLQVVGDLHAVISMGVKMDTGLSDVSAESYLRQAEKIFSSGDQQSAGWTHPESYIRARALQLWHRDGEGANTAVEQMISGPLKLDELDLLAQQRVGQLTRRLIDAYLAPGWIRGESLLAHARLFFDGYRSPSAGHDDAKLHEDLQTPDEKLQDYYCYVLLDFVTADRDNTEPALAAAIELTRRLGWQGRFAAIAVKELRLRKKQFEKLQQEAATLIAQLSDDNA